MKAADIASKAAELVGGERAHVHGDKVINHDKIAAMWNGVLFAAGKVPAVPLDGHDVANMMEALKIARRYLGRFNPDDYVDGAGYAACAGEIAAAAEARLEPRLSVVGGARRSDIETNP
jgi:hypothetical protein